MDVFFPVLQQQRSAASPLKVVEEEQTWDIFCNVNGGGVNGQADAVCLGIARALKVIQPAHDELLRPQGLLTRDARSKERKKYGRRGARRGFQFSKR